MPLLCRMPWAPCNGTTSTPPKLVVMLAPNHSTLRWHPAMAPRPLPQSWPSPSPPTIAHYNGTLQWHSAMAPRPLPQSSPQPYHTTMAPSNGTTSTPSKLVVTLPPTIPHYNGTLRWHPAMAPRPLPPKLVVNPSLRPHYKGNVQWHPAMAPRPLHPAMAPWCHVQSAPPPLLEVRTPYSYRYLGKNASPQP